MSVLATAATDIRVSKQSRPSAAFTDAQWETAVATSMFYFGDSRKKQEGIVTLMKANYDADNSDGQRTSDRTPFDYVDRLGRETSPLFRALEPAEQKCRLHI